MKSPKEGSMQRYDYRSSYILSQYGKELLTKFTHYLFSGDAIAAKPG
jgi:hypothetical protein